MQAKEEANRPPLKLSIAIARLSTSGLIVLADKKGFFREAGLDVSIKTFPSGLACVEALCRGEVEMATAADVVFALKMFDSPYLRAIASIGMSNLVEILARRDRNINKPADLKGKRVGVSVNTVSEYYFDSFLLLNSIPAREVTAVSIPAYRIAEALIKGEVDAISSWDTHLYRARKGLSDNVISWPAQNNVDWYWLLITRDNLAPSPQVSRFLKAIVKAESFLLANNEEAKNIITHTWGFDPEFIRQTWDKNRLGVSLSQSMIDSIENLAKWKLGKDNKPFPIPNYLEYIYTEALDELDPRAVTIFR
jgi:ABC-type nitrate/sulfonate/bicarbonate transport system substrate-binding protein